MPSYNHFNVFVQNLGIAVHELLTDALTLMLTNVAPVATNTVYANLTEIANGNGYTTGGSALTGVTYANVSGTSTLQANQVVWTASGGSIAAFRYAVLYDATPTTPLKPLIAWWDYGSSITLNTGDSVTVVFNSTSPGTIFTIS